MNARDFAKRKTILSELMEGRTQVKIEDLLGQKITLIDFEMIQIKSDEEAFPVCIFEEYPENFAFGGYVLGEIITGLLSEYGENAKAELTACKGIPMILSRRKSKSASNREYTVVEIIDEKTGGKK